MNNQNKIWITQSKHARNLTNASVSSLMQHPGVIKFKGQNVNGTVIHEIFREAEEIIGANLNENRLNIQKMHKFTIEHFSFYFALHTFKTCFYDTAQNWKPSRGKE